MMLSIIVAMGANRVIGRNNELPWHLPADMKYFREKTMGHCVVTGRKNFESIPDKFRPLKGRTNIVITRQKNYGHEGIVVVSSVDEAIDAAEKRGESECFIIGGGEIFRQTLGLCDKIYLTRIHHDFDGDVFFPELKENEWREIRREDFSRDEKNQFDYSFTELIRTSP